MFNAALVANEPESLVEQKPCNCTALHTTASVCSSTFASPFSRVVEEPHGALLADVGQLGPSWFGATRESGLESRRGRDRSRASSMLLYELTPYQGLCGPWEESFRTRCAGGE